jgi:riboflavin biosynthesis pyrimidine reductase
MKPYVICHMVASIDGRTLISRWRPKDASRRELFARLHDGLAIDAWLVGRVTGQEYARLDAYPDHSDQIYPREPWFTRRNARAHGIVLDAHGRIAWGRSEIDGDPVVVVLTEQVSDTHLAGLRQDGVSYMFAGKQDLDLGLALNILGRDFGIKRLEINGGGVTNGAFLRAGLIDEISLATFPVVDGARRAVRLRFNRCRGRGTSIVAEADARKQPGAGGRSAVAPLSPEERLLR